MQICGICGSSHSPMDCDIIQIVSHIPDKSIPSKARLTVPEDLELRKMADGSYNIMALRTIDKGTQFGPLQAKKLCTLLPSINFPVRLFYNNEGDFSEYYLDTSDENECNWMMFVTHAKDFEEQNLICYQDGEDIYYVTIKDIYLNETLKIWYSPYYASKMNRDILIPINNNKNTQNLKSNNFIDHLVRNKSSIASREVWSCKFCGRLEKNLPEFASHLLQHYNFKTKRYCHICNFLFRKKEGYQKHMKFLHSTDVTLDSSVQLNEKTNLTQNCDIKLQNFPKDAYIGGPLLFNELLNDSMDNNGLTLNSNMDTNHMDLAVIENHNNLFDNENLNLNMEYILPDNEREMDNFNFELAPPDNEQFVCDICLKPFKHLKALIWHMNMHIGNFTCFECDKVFSRKENLDCHPCKAFYKLQCSLCEKLFYQKKYLTLHMKLYHSNYCKFCKQMFKTGELLQDHNCPEKERRSKIKYTCDECHKVFNHKTNLIIHRKRHKQSEKYNCPICNKILGSYKTYRKHTKIHEGCSYKCDICDRIFMRSDNLKVHKESVHFAAGKETCEICKKSFKTKNLLKKHIKLHDSTAEVKCQYCPLKYKQLKYLKQHIKNQHNVNKVTQSATLNNDKQYACPKCGKKMKLESSVKRHLEVFHGESKMEYKYLKKEKRTEHKKVSISIMPFSCPKCDKKMKHEYSIKRHIESVHPDYKGKYKSVKTKSETNKQVEEDELTQALENINYNTDEINREITIEIDKLLNNPETFTSDSNDRLVESLINTAVGENNLDNDDTGQQKDAMLSMPDLDLDHDLDLVSCKKTVTI
ncbi:PR domain zinc finger protein 15-like isoform X1 [Diorhabda sublineata]|uniref:PR domain zinc finger protein 15-like isoform X1 n=1 Tax=Diorhabda sublineata TaxID=1163346 RepID=UPI0024E0DD9D|nr:PR domain zinc finger protein 15-like isoform X1 [Diorhabda sublineata]XP_056632943.1 PR domain zinc finger protein 15-like isoform X1 [Diorhabda sublineata]